MSNENITLNGKQYMPVVDIESIEMEVEIESIGAVIGVFNSDTQWDLLNQLAEHKDPEIRNQVKYFLNEYIGEFDNRDEYIEHVFHNSLK